MQDNEDDKALGMRDEKGRIRKGYSLNPSGMTRATQMHNRASEAIDMADKFRDMAPEVFLEMIKLIFDPKTPPSPKANLIKEFFNRGFGKPAITIAPSEATVTGEIDWSKADPELLGKVVALIDDKEPGDE